MYVFNKMQNIILDYFLSQDNQVSRGSIQYLPFVHVYNLEVLPGTSKLENIFFKNTRRVVKMVLER